MNYLRGVTCCRRTEIGERALSNNFKAAAVDCVLNELARRGEIRMTYQAPGPKGGPRTVMVELVEPTTTTTAPAPTTTPAAPEPTTTTTSPESKKKRDSNKGKDHWCRTCKRLKPELDFRPRGRGFPCNDCRAVATKARFAKAGVKLAD